ncbi:hypothetical protein TM7_0594 [candidate division TM7 genomosp. GTL1]|nr:hypothetical protein TM7_0594 [candidate division TM7 genomosp. GTL1]
MDQENQLLRPPEPPTYTPPQVNPQQPNTPASEQPVQQPQYQAPQPVAYDSEGRPLYHHPPQLEQYQTLSQQNYNEPQNQPAAVNSGPQPQVVYMTRPMEPLSPHISERARQRHEETSQKYPFLNISEGEFLITNVKRHPIGLISVWAPEAIAILLFGAMYLYSLTAEGTRLLLSVGVTIGGLSWIGFLVVLLLGLLAWAGTIIYLANQFYLTNESVIQFIQTGLFSRKEQTISLQNIEDASFRQHGIIQHLFNYGSIRLSTEGEETTYRFYFAQNPRRQIALLNNAVEAFKNGRPVADIDDDD